MYRTQTLTKKTYHKGKLLDLNIEVIEVKIIDTRITNNTKAYWCPKECGKTVQIIAFFRTNAKYMCNKCDNIFTRKQLLQLNRVRIQKSYQTI